ncbi:MAG: FAD-binding oxidoreductase [Betaproteobacteria bacterium]|nr:FAD-binding oxidoreductase [Betaproteobacteria bacterium]
MGGGTQFDVAVIGGGLVGGAIAFGLRALGPRLLLLDEGDQAFRAARGNFGLVWVQGKGAGLPRYGAWTQRSRREWPRFAAEVFDASGLDVALSQRGGIHLCLDPRELEARAAALAALVDQPGFERYDYEVLDRNALAKQLPGLGIDVAGGTWCSLDGHCNPLRLLHGLHLALHRAGCVLRPQHPVARITPRADRFDVATPAGTFTAERVVVAAGLGSVKLAPMVGLAAPLRPQKGQVIALERMRPFLPLPLSTLRQTDDGTVLIGDSQEEGGLDETVALPVLAAMAARAVRAFPALRAAHVNRTWAALRVMSPDGFPIYAQSAAHPGAFLAACHSGVTLAAVHAEVLAPAIAAGSLPPSLAPFSPRRFDVPQAA